MRKGYWVANVDVLDPEAYKAYVQANAVAFAKFGARFVVRSGRHVVVEGTSAPRQVVIEFKDYETAHACHDSEEYRHAAKLRDAAGTVDLVIVEGYDGPQPG